MQKAQIAEYLAYVCRKVGMSQTSNVAEIVSCLVERGKTTEEEVARFFPGKK